VARGPQRVHLYEQQGKRIESRSLDHSPGKRQSIAFLGFPLRLTNKFGTRDVLMTSILRHDGIVDRSGGRPKRLRSVILPTYLLPSLNVDYES
jgi:hypothetical protein